MTLDQAIATKDQLLPIADVCKDAGLSKSEIYRRMKAGTFPQCVFVGRFMARWSSLEVQDWIANELAKRKSA